MNTPTPKHPTHTANPQSHIPNPQSPKIMYRLATLIISFLLLPATIFAQEATFEGIGDLEGGPFRSNARSVSADGSVVVGASYVENGQVAYRWESGTMESLGDLEGGQILSTGIDVSADGSVVVGSSDSGTGLQAYRWENGTMVGLGDLREGKEEYSIGNAVSANGLVVVGSASTAIGLEAFRYDAVVDTMVGLGSISGGSSSGGYEVSADGSVVVGSAQHSVIEAFRWEDGIMEGMGWLEGGSAVSSANAISRDGSIVVGGSQSARSMPFSQAFRWEAGRMQALGDLEGGIMSSQAQAVSADGSIVVGYGTVGDGSVNAFIWSAQAGMRNLKEVLENEYGLDLTGWVLRNAADISDDGTVIVGNGINPDGMFEGYRAFFGSPVAGEENPEALANVLSAPSPNPASEMSTVTISVERGQRVSVEVFDALGRHVQTVYDGALAAGMSERLTLDASALPAGVYVVRATGEDFVKSRRVTVVQ